MESVLTLFVWFMAIVASVCVCGIMLEILHTLCLLATKRKYRGTDTLKVYEQIYDLIQTARRCYMEYDYSKEIYCFINDKNETKYAISKKSFKGVSISVNSTDCVGRFYNNFCIDLPKALREELYKKAKRRIYYEQATIKEAEEKHKKQDKEKSVAFVLGDLGDSKKN